MTKPCTPSTRLSPLGHIITDPHSSHPIRPSTLTLCAIGRAFTNSSLLQSHLHTSTHTPSYMRQSTQYLTHTDTMRLRSLQSGLNHSDLFLNDNIINHTLQILHQHSPYTTLGVRSDHKTVSFVSHNSPKVTIMSILVTINYENV